MKNLRCLPLLLLVIPFATSFASSDDYPGTDWETVSPESVGMDPAKLASFAEYGMIDDEKRKPDALLVIHQGKVVLEKYAYGFHPTMRHLSWSIAKSVTTVVAGIAESDRLVTRDLRIHDYFPFPARNPTEQAYRERLTLTNLLNMTSGIEWKEDYSTKAPLRSDVIQMLYMDARKDRAAFVATRPMTAAPGEHYYYSTGDMNLAMGVLKYRMTTENYDRYPWTRLFDRIGMKNVVWERDDSGSFDGGSSIYATARDYARFGYLLLKNGRWANEQIVSKEWITQIRTLSPGLASGSVRPEGTKTYGMGFWLNEPAPKWDLPAPYPTAPADTYFALGHNGQMITIIPSKDLVIVRLAHDDGDDAMDWNEFFTRAAAAVVVPPEGEFTIEIEPTPGSFHRSPEDTDPAPPVYTRKRTFPLLFTKLLAAVRAKDYCACRFVVGQTEAYCTALVKNGFPLLRKKINEKTKTATFGIMPAQRARMMSERFGCSLL